MSEKRVLSFDPGGSTGWALYEESGALPYAGLKRWAFGTLGPEPHHKALWDLMHGIAPTLVIWEEFIYQRRELDRGVSLELISRNYIGIMELYCELRAVNGYESRLAYKKFWDDTKLGKVNLYSQTKHSRDATRHLLYYLTFVKKDPRWIQALKA